MKINIARTFNPAQLVFLALITCLSVTFFGQAEAQAPGIAATTTPSTVFLQVSKVISPAHFPGTLDEDDFSFHISGPGGSWDIPHAGVVELGVGEYDIMESYSGNDSVGFDPEDWTVYWVGDLCEGPTDVPAEDPGSIVVTESDLGRFTDQNPARCNAENQYKPEDENNGGGGGGTSTTLRIEKIVAGTSTLPSEFSFSLNGGAAVAFEADGTNELTVATGTYEILEVGTTTGYTVSYNGCSNLVLSTSTVTTCTITNTWNSGNGGGGGDDKYRIEGFVWHDEDENGEKIEDEGFLEGWIVTITNGTTTATTTTNSAGYYSFEVEAGTWTVFETLEEGWNRSFPTTEDGVYVIEVPQNGEEESALVSFLSWFFPTAEAAIIDTYSGYNFGNFQGGNGGGGGDDDDDDDGSSSSGGRSGSSGNRGGNPAVLGDQVSIIPLGAAQGGFGGSSPEIPSFLAFLWPVLTWFGI